MTALERVSAALEQQWRRGDGNRTTLARAAIEALRTSGTENTDRIFNAMLDRILKEEV